MCAVGQLLHMQIATQILEYDITNHRVGCTYIDMQYVRILKNLTSLNHVDLVGILDLADSGTERPVI